MPFPRPEDEDPPLTRRDHAWIAIIAGLTVLAIGTGLLELGRAAFRFFAG